jgi:hypothetical protein
MLNFKRIHLEVHLLTLETLLKKLKDSKVPRIWVPTSILMGPSTKKMLIKDLKKWQKILHTQKFM